MNEGLHQKVEELRTHRGIAVRFFPSLRSRFTLETD